MSAIHFSDVSFSYTSAVPIVTGASFDLGPGWTGLVGANGAGKSTLLSLITGSSVPDAGVVSVDPAGLPPVLCEQRVDALTEAIEAFGHAWDRDAIRLRASLDLGPGDLGRWSTLSPGERKRWQIGAALGAQPDVLLLDEPTNHLDAEARDLLLGALRAFRGCGVIVSHDRRLLDDLTDRTLRVVGGRVELWNGPYGVAHREWRARDELRHEQYATMRAEAAKLRRRIADQRRTSAQKDAQRLRERRAAGKDDLDTRGTAATYKHERGQKTGAQTVASMSKSLQDLSTDIERTTFDKTLGGRIDFAFEPANKEFLLRFDGPVTAGDRTLFHVDVAVRRTDRIRIAGPNGTGKTSLLKRLVECAAIPADRLLHLDQETTVGEAVAWLDEVRRLPSEDRGRVMSIVAALGADPGPLLASDSPSPGEARKLALALGLGTPIWLLVLDEPTNHLDLPSIERLEEALAAYRGALILITHDDTLASAVTDTVWEVTPDGVA
ncbi:MAG TPA: ATP-binding cassette domain-containing protein [Acidimicrobiia bacterium]|nr:ATP-binding cassette domain-containing protein [Acidimicrobiia bacterium]